MLSSTNQVIKNVVSALRIEFWAKFGDISNFYWFRLDLRDVPCHVDTCPATWTRACHVDTRCWRGRPPRQHRRILQSPVFSLNWSLILNLLSSVYNNKFNNNNIINHKYLRLFWLSFAFAFAFAFYFGLLLRGKQRLPLFFSFFLFICFPVFSLGEITKKQRLIKS
jgi:hypothetical protein